MKYVVLKDFLDRYENNRHCKPGEYHNPPTEERAQLLIDQGFIAVVNDDQELDKEPPTINPENLIKTVGRGVYELPNGEKVKGKEKALKEAEKLIATGEVGVVDEADQSKEV